MENMVDKLDLTIKQLFTRMKRQSPEPEVCPEDEMLVAYHENRLTSEETEGIEQHLVHCSKCTDNLISFSEAESSFSPEAEGFTTVDMVKKAKDLVRPRDKFDLWEKLSSWFTVFRPIPIMATASAVLVFIILGIFTLTKQEVQTINLSVLARMQSGALTRGSAQYKDEEIQDGGVLHSGDMIKIKFRVEKETYVYLISLDALGNLTKLYPSKDTESPKKIKPNETYVFPEKEGWLRLDDNTGQETLYLLASPEAIGDIEQRIEQLKESGIDKIAKAFPGVKIQTFSFKHE